MTMREEIDAWIAAEGMVDRVEGLRLRRCFKAAYRAGAEMMRERAAKVANEFIGADPIMDRIRALPLDAD
jgi:hypothetical protein